MEYSTTQTEFISYCGFIVAHFQSLQKDNVKDVKAIIQNVPLDKKPVKLGHAALRTDIIHVRIVINMIHLRIVNSLIHS